MNVVSLIIYSLSVIGYQTSEGVGHVLFNACLMEAISLSN